MYYPSPPRFIRRYGRSKSTFTFEAGRKCQTGEGLFTFKVEDGNQLFHAVEERTKAMKAMEKAGKLLKTTSSSHSTTPSPKSPGEGYVMFNEQASTLPTTPSGKSIERICDRTKLPVPVVATLPSPPPCAYDVDPIYEEPDSGFGTMESDPILLPLPPQRHLKNIEVTDDYSEPYSRDIHTPVSNDDDEYADPVGSPKVDSMPELVAHMNRSRLASRERSQDSYDHIDLQKAANKRRSVEEVGASDNLYGALSLTTKANKKANKKPDSDYEEAVVCPTNKTTVMEEDHGYYEIGHFKN